MKILMVCLGNICRSPLAEGILKSKVEKHNLKWSVESAGTGSWHIGDLPDKRSIEVARKNGIDITDQRARQFSAEDLDRYDLIVAMDHSNYNNILSKSQNGDHSHKVKMLLNYAHPGMNMAVPDPYYEGGFDKVFQMIDEACEELLDQELEKKNEK